MRARRFTSLESRARSPKGSDGRAKWWRRARREPPSIACAKRRLVFPDDADDHALHDDVAFVQAERLHRIIGGLQSDPAAGFAIEPLDRRALAVDQRDDGLARIGLIPLLNDDVVAVFDVLVDHLVAADLEDVTAAPA